MLRKKTGHRDRNGIPHTDTPEKVGAVVKLDLDDGFSRYELSLR